MSPFARIGGYSFIFTIAQNYFILIIFFGVNFFFWSSLTQAAYHERRDSLARASAWGEWDWEWDLGLKTSLLISQLHLFFLSGIVILSVSLQWQVWFTPHIVNFCWPQPPLGAVWFESKVITYFTSPTICPKIVTAWSVMIKDNHAGNLFVKVVAYFSDKNVIVLIESGSHSW